MKKIITLTAAALVTVAAGSFAQESQQASIKFAYGSSVCASSTGDCMARAEPSQPEVFLIRGLTIAELNELNELIDIRAGETIPAYTFINSGNFPSS